MLKTCQLSKNYGKLSVLHSLDLEISDGHIMSLVGSSGSGKSTLLRLISGLEKPDDGQITLNGKIVSNENIFVPPEKRDCSLVFQDYALFPNMTIKQNIYFGKNSNENKEKIERLIEITDIAKIMDKFPHECSGGEQQRTALVRSLAIGPSIILMDEPLSNLDFSLKQNLAVLVRKLLKEFQTTALIVTHDVMDALEISDKIAVIDEGKIIQEGEPNEIYNNPNSKKTALLFGETNFIPYEIFPNSKFYFHDADSDKKWISIRPDQFILYDEENSEDKKVFSGQVEYLKKIGSKYKVIMRCEKFSIKISLNTLNKISMGQKLEVISL